MAITGLLVANDDNSPNLGIAYTSVIGAGGTAGDYQLDIYHLNERIRGNRPVVIGIHGGGWCIGDKSLKDFAKNKANFFIRKNKCIFVSINYRLSPVVNLGIGTALWSASRVKFPDHYNDMATAIRWVRDNISSYGGDPNKLILMGHSAGSQSCTVLATNHEFINAVGVPTSSIKGAICVDSEGYNILDQILNPSTDTDLGDGDPTTVRKMYENAFGIYPGIHTGTLYRTKDYATVGIATTAYNRASPDQNLNTPNIPKLMIIGRGNSDRVAKHSTFYADMVSAGVAGTYISYPNIVDGTVTTYTHIEITDCIGAPSDPPPERSLPVGIGNVSTEITKFISSLNL